MSFRQLASFRGEVAISFCFSSIRLSPKSKFNQNFKPKDCWGRVLSLVNIPSIYTSLVFIALFIYIFFYLGFGMAILKRLYSRIVLCLDTLCRNTPFTNFTEIHLMFSLLWCFCCVICSVCNTPHFSLTALPGLSFASTARVDIRWLGYWLGA